MIHVHVYTWHCMYGLEHWNVFKWDLLRHPTEFKSIKLEKLYKSHTVCIQLLQDSKIWSLLKFRQSYDNSNEDCLNAKFVFHLVNGHCKKKGVFPSEHIYICWVHFLQEGVWEAASRRYNSPRTWEAPSHCTHGLYLGKGKYEYINKYPPRKDIFLNLGKVFWVTNRVLKKSKFLLEKNRRPRVEKNKIITNIFLVTNHCVSKKSKTF